MTSLPVIAGAAVRSSSTASRRLGSSELPVAATLARGLPAAFLDGAEFPAAFLSAFDAVLAPAVATIDEASAYVDPGTAPADFVQWLAGWVSLDGDQRWTTSQWRDRVRRATEVYAWIGTVRGIVDGVELLCGVRPEVSDSGGAASSQRPSAALPGDRRLGLVIRVPPGSDLAAVERAVVQLKPAHVPHRVEVSG